MSSPHRAVIAYLIVVAGAVLWLGLIVAAPVLMHAGATGWGEALYTFFHPICHQIDGRSLQVFGEPLGVCSRCSAIYAGFLVGVLAYPMFRPVRKPHPPSRTMLVVALIPMAVDVVLGLTGLHDATLGTRLVTGAIFGLLVPFVVVPVFLGAVHEYATHQPTPSHLQKGSTDA